MNYKLKSLLGFLCLIAFNIYQAQDIKKQEFKVSGNCEICKDRIESTAKKSGAVSASWDIETKTLTLETDTRKTVFNQILKEIARAGYDNEQYKAPDSAYGTLPDCCLYGREKKSLETHTESSHDGHDHSQKSKENTIEKITMVSHKQSIAIDKKKAGLTFNINSKELLKAACCNLSESFETNATVDVAFNNAVIGGKQLRMLGLDQKYTLLTKEQLPGIRGLASAYGLSFIPGRWIGGIQLTKGGSTVVNGYESITGQINTELVKAEHNDKSSINLFSDFENREEINIVHTDRIGEHWNQSILLHGNATLGTTDHNKDGFLDRPKGHQINTSYLINYIDLDHTGFALHSGISFLSDKRIAGQTNFNEKIPQLQPSAYGVDIDLKNFQLWNKTGYVFKGKPYQSLGLMNQFAYHKQESFFGKINYFGEQKTFYSNFVFESILGNTNHKYKTGASFLYDEYDETLRSEGYRRTEKVPGLFLEYTLTGEKYALVAGVRTDFHNLAGTQFTPRINFRYNINSKSTVRISAGRGFRTANVFAENQHFFTSNRSIEFLNPHGKIYGLKPEIAWNYGISLQQEFRILNKKSTLLIDFFRTDFTQQVLADLDIHAQKLIFYNLDGKSYSNSFQAQWDIQPLKNFDIRLAYKYYDVQADYHSGRREVPFVAKNRAFINLSYATEKSSKGGFWSFDTTLNWVGKQKLPNLNSNPASYRLLEYSNPYFNLNAQLSKNFGKNIRVYLGAENITNTIQDRAIIDAKNPFGNYFDAGMIYAPIMPRNGYIGVDFNL